MKKYLLGLVAIMLLVGCATVKPNVTTPGTPNCSKQEATIQKLQAQNEQQSTKVAQLSARVTKDNLVVFILLVGGLIYAAIKTNFIAKIPAIMAKVTPVVQLVIAKVKAVVAFIVSLFRKTPPPTPPTPTV